MRIIAIMPIKLNNERLPGKNTKFLGDKPLLQYELEALLKVENLSGIYVFCSNDSICEFLPEGVEYINRSKYLDLPSANFNQIFDSFIEIVDADIYVYAHATAPFVSTDSINTCINAVVSGKYDSAFTATKIQDYLWQDGSPMNFDANNLPRSQDLVAIYRESSGIYAFTKEVYLKYNRRIGINPYILEVSAKEAVDINCPEDFKIAEIMLDVIL